MSFKSDLYYSENSEKIYAQYQSLRPIEIYRQVLPAFDIASGMVLDVGSGSGRDSQWLAELGHKVISVEPARGLRNTAIERGIHPNVTYFDTTFPSLEGLERFVGGFDLILCAAVIMHLDTEERMLALRNLIQLMKPGVNSRAIITYKMAPPEPERAMFSLSGDEVQAMFNTLPVNGIVTFLNEDLLGRDDTRWYTSVLYKDAMPSA